VIQRWPHVRRRTARSGRRRDGVDNIQHRFFNFLNPILGLIYGFAGINVQRLTPENQPAVEALPQVPLVDQLK
jgi:hypothetical protein